jgi:hypothetical protein
LAVRGIRGDEERAGESCYLLSCTVIHKATISCYSFPVKPNLLGCSCSRAPRRLQAT